MTVYSRINNPYQYFPYVNKHANMFFVAYYVYLIHMDHPYFSVLNKLKNNCNNIRDLCYSISLSHVKNKSQSNNYWCKNWISIPTYDILNWSKIHDQSPNLSGCGIPVLVGPGAAGLLTGVEYSRIKDSAWNIPYCIVTTRIEVEVVE